MIAIFRHAWLALIVLVGECGPVAGAAEPTTAATMVPGGRAVLVAGPAGVQQVSWPAMQPVDRLASRLEHIHDLRFSPAGDRLVVAGGNPAEFGAVEIWDWPAGQLVSTIQTHQDVVYRVAWRSDGKELATASMDGSCCLITLAGEQLRRRFSGHSRPVLAIGYLDHATLASAGVDQTLRIWRAEDGHLLRTLDNHLAAIHDMAVQPGPAGEGRRLVTVSQDQTVRLWQPAIGRLVRFARLPTAQLAVAWGDDQQVFAAGQDGLIHAVDVQRMQVVQQWEGQVGVVHQILLADDGSLLVIGQEGYRRIQLSGDPPLESSPLEFRL